MSPRRISSNTADGSARSRFRSRGWVTGSCGGSRCLAWPSTGSPVRSWRLSSPGVAITLAGSAPSWAASQSRRAAGMSVLTSSRTTPAYLRAVSSAVTIPMIAPGERSTSSPAWSVHGSSFAPLETRKKEQASSDARGKSALRLSAITCSRGTHPAWSGSGSHRGRLAGTLIRTKRRFRRPGSVTSTARLRPRLLMNGNGCAASAASGVRIGSTQSAKYRARKSRWDGSDPRHPRSGPPGRAAQGAAAPRRAWPPAPAGTAAPRGRP